MKKAIALILVLMIGILTVSCSQFGSTADNAKSTSAPESTKNGYVMSDSPKEGSVIDGVMTDILNSDKILEKTTASFLDDGILYEVNVRQYTDEGTFKAFEEHLERLKDTGVNILWFMPIHPISETGRKGTLGSYYAVSDYMAVNEEFGTIDDFRHLLDKAHSMGFKVILDWVANHTGWDNSWVREHDDWYVHDDSGNITSPYDWSDTAELDYENYEMRAEMIKCMQYWVEDVGVDGFRCDHAIGVPAAFWNAAVYKLKSINSEIFMLAEASPAESLTRYAFDSCYNDELFSQMSSIKGGIAPSTLEKGLTVNTNFVDGSFPMNYLDNHDKNSYNMSIVARFGKAYNPLLAIEYLAPGMPLIYTGNEMFSDKEFEFFEKDPITWEECILQDYLTELASLKTGNDSLDATNKQIEYLKTGNDKVFAFEREKEGNKVIFVGNMFYEDITNADVSLDYDKLDQVIHYDGSEFDYSDKQLLQSDLKFNDLKAYEFYIFTTE